MYKYNHGGNATFETGKENIIDLSANINPLGIQENVCQAIVQAIPQIDRYPDNSSMKLREKISQFENVPPDWIFCGNGASDIIFRLPRAVKAKKVLMPAPTFSDYERSACSYGADVIFHTLSVTDNFALNNDFIETVRIQKPDLVFVCNPNNPTGLLTDIKLIGTLLECCRQIGAWLVIDECFLNFVEQADDYTSNFLLKEYSNLVILKAFTKVFTLPGIRLGYALCSNDKLISDFYFHGADWSVSNLAQAAGIAALENTENFLNQTVLYVSAERKRIKEELTHLGYKVFDSTANYLFLQNPFKFDLYTELDKKGIRIRACANYHGLDESYYRIAVSTKENNTIALSHIAGVTNENS